MSPRSDATRNRALIISAAEQVFHEHGAAAPLELVVTRSGVGRGTLYRHFRDRESLIGAVYSARLDALEDLVAAVGPDDRLEQLVVEIAALQLDSPGLLSVMRDSVAGRRRLHDVGERATSLVEAALGEARTTGAVRGEVGIDDVFLLVAMIEGVVASYDPAEAPAAVGRALELMLPALRSPARRALPVPRSRIQAAGTVVV